MFSSIAGMHGFDHALDHLPALDNVVLYRKLHARREKKTADMEPRTGGGLSKDARRSLLLSEEHILKILLVSCSPCRNHVRYPQL